MRRTKHSGRPKRKLPRKEILRLEKRKISGRKLDSEQIKQKPMLIRKTLKILRLLSKLSKTFLKIKKLVLN